MGVPLALSFTEWPGEAGSTHWGLDRSLPLDWTYTWAPSMVAQGLGQSGGQVTR